MLKDGKIFRVVEENCWNVEKRIEDMNKNGIHKFNYSLSLKNFYYSEIYGFGLFDRCSTTSIIYGSRNVFLLGRDFL